MLDVHPPHHAASTWRDFFIHIATIVIGLLIAVGLEQAVEAVHHHHQRQELVQALLEDTKRATHDAEAYDLQIDLRYAWTTQRIAEVRSAIQTRQPLPVAAAFPFASLDVPGAPSWTAAQSSGLLAVLSQDEVRSLGEVSTLAINFEPHAKEIRIEHDKRRRFDQHYLISTPSEHYDYSTATPAELKDYLDLLLTEQTALLHADHWLRYIRGANAAVLEGSRNIEEVDNAEDRFLTKDPTQ